MKQVKRITSSQYDGVVAAVNVTLECFPGITVPSFKMFCGTIVVAGCTNEYGNSITVYTDGNDFCCTPDFALDWTDSEWSGVSANGVGFDIVDQMPVVGA